MLLEAKPNDVPTTIRWDIAAIFVSLELSRSKWLITSLSPGSGEKMSKHMAEAGDSAALLVLLGELRAKARVRAGGDFPIVTIQAPGARSAGD